MCAPDRAVCAAIAASQKLYRLVSEASSAGNMAGLVFRGERTLANP
jgi:hypothetical protein